MRSSSADRLDSEIVLPPRVERLLAFFYLLPAFVVALSVDGELVRINLNWLQAATSAALIVVAIRQRRDVSWVFWTYGALLALHIPYAIAHLSPIVGYTSDYLEKFLLLWGYLLLTSLAAVILLGKRAAIEIFVALAAVSVMVGIVAFTLNRLTGSTIAVHAYGDVIRMQALLTEPSAFAPLVPLLILFGLDLRRWILVLLGLVALVLTFSPTVFLTTVISLVAAGLVSPRTRSLVSVALACGLSLLALAYLTIDVTAIDESSSSIHFTVARLLQGIQSVTSLGDEGVNVRFQSLLEAWQFLEHNELLLTGYGLNSAAVVFLELYGTPMDNALWISVLTFYGVVGCAFFLLACAWTLIRLVQVRHPYLNIYLSFLVASMLNSAQGFLAYSFVIGGIFIAVESVRSGSRARRSRVVRTDPGSVA